ncbi:PilZ domain-containing protein [Methylobacterium dankookense]|uniref:PilZ domain-containing protein n=1 Tax=Methylobacterium dankookense TaxID=560405 RepID=A0A564FYK6_9HYPH|nr:PilZ domain-containing protein [Methylobacterium dankookense]GJD54420.1 hypothetical protein IFDJLNFL_0291 [Methylobacterium dankookense]VUF12780.1 hypothetical protein MTDSW087_02475 [Methylobacterium dankookense]
MSDGRRTSPRSNAFIFGQLHPGSEGAPVECMVWDISSDGAMIEVPDQDAVPDRFSLTLPEDDAPRNATVIWRTGRRLGLRF